MHPSRRSPAWWGASALLGAAALVTLAPTAAAGGEVIGELVDVSEEFRSRDSTYFVASEVTEYDTASGTGTLRWKRHVRQPSLSFNKLDLPFVRGASTEFPGTQYDRDPVLPFAISFVGPRTVRLTFASRDRPPRRDSLMLAGELVDDGSWSVEESDERVVYTSAAGRIELIKQPWQIRIYDADGRLLTQTQTLGDPATFSAPTPFSFVRRARDLGRSFAGNFRLAADEKLFGCGESFTRLDKRGQRVVLDVRDAMGAQSPRMYKPIPFFLSSRGYGMFLHTSTPTTFDFGHDFDQANVLYTGDDVFDVFLFLGRPKQVVEAYTAVTGRSPVPPLWSFGLWMSRITYKSEEEVRRVADQLREHEIPSDVIHLDTGWFETEWQCDYRFAPSRFSDPGAMIADLGEQGFRVSLWQLPYFTRKNRLFAEAAREGYFVKDDGGRYPYEDGVLDFSNPAACRWYTGLLGELLELGVGAIKVDFGEDAPRGGIYASGRTGWYEHNLYPLRYNKTVAELTRETTGENIIWARSAWAGSQRYPLHWGGDAENTDSAMAATLRAGLSLGMCGFTYWSHDAGGFVQRAPRALYRRWLPFAALVSHTRCHGAPPREPWEYDEAFTDDFRRTMEMRYRLMPYLYAQAQQSSQHGYPMIRTLFFEFPDDPTSWLIEDQYMLGSDLLVAPLFCESDRRQVYLPPGRWIDYQSERVYKGRRWHELPAGPVPIVVLVRDGSMVPHVPVAQSTGEIDWKALELRAFSSGRQPVHGRIATPGSPPQAVTLAPNDEGQYRLDPPPGDTPPQWRTTHVGGKP